MGTSKKMGGFCIHLCTERDWDLLLLMLGILQHYMIDSGYFIRGALCHSELYFDERFLFGKGIIMAHEIESEIAKVPRIILHSSYKDAANAQDDPHDKIIFDAFTAVAGMLPIYLHDADGYMFVNYLGIVQAMQDFAEEYGIERYRIEDTFTQHRDRVIFSIKDCEKRYLPQGVMKKFLWCLQYHNRFCSENDYNEYMIL